MTEVGKEVFNQNVLEVHENIRLIDWQPLDGRTNHILDEKLCARKLSEQKMGNQPTKLMHLSLGINTYTHSLFSALLLADGRSFINNACIKLQTNLNHQCTML